MSFPEAGAIFLANNSTRKECLERKLFGLPAKYIDFVAKIKIGMLLFLYDFHAKELYGVFEASSDGGFNLVPDAYKSSKSKFPAQVRVNILWNCAPLQKDAFKKVIQENAEHKFNFGLSTEQVCGLLKLFKEKRIQRSHMSEGYYQRPNRIVALLDESRPLSARELKPLQEANDSNNLPEVKLSQTQCGQGRDICDLTTLKSLPESMRKKLASIVVFDPKPTPDPDCSIPFPSLEPAESEDPLLHEPVLKLTVGSPGLDEPIDDSTGCQVYEHQDEEKNHMSTNSRASVLYSDIREERLSVFKRLSGWSKVIEQKSGRVNALTEHLGKNTNFENIRHSLKRSDTKHTVHSHGEKSSINTSVVSGLGNDVKMGAKNEQPEKLSGTNVEICKDSKRKDNFLADKQQKRKCLRKTKTCDELSYVPNFSQGSCKTETNGIVTGDAVVVTSPSLTKPFICGGDEESVDGKLDHSIQLRTSCDQDPVEMLLAQYKEYLIRSRMED